MALASHLAIAPVVIPAITAALAMLVMRRQRHVGVAVSLAGCALTLVAALLLFATVQDDVVRVYPLGNWPAPFGIVLVLDRLAATMLVLASVLALAVLVHATITAADRKGWHFHPLFQFQLLGLNGAFLTGDLFNLFVFFEVLLIASYGLMLHGQGPARMKAGLGYVVINIVGSSLFLIALGLLYGLTGTLTMADMAVQVAGLEAADRGLLRVAGLLLMTVFGLKAAAVPLNLWLPRTYSAAMPVVAALFAIMTKVGVYAMIRVMPLVFGTQAGPANDPAGWVTQPWLLPAAGLTVLVGFAGVLAARAMREQAAFAVLGSTGTLLLAVSAWTPASIAAALYYLIHATLAGAALFLVADVTLRRRGQYGDAITPTPTFAGQAAAGALFLVTALAIVGLPPLSGFLGKLLILQASFGAPGWPVVWGVILLTTFIGVVGFARSGSDLFWKPAEADADPITCQPRHIAEFLAPAALVLLLVGWTAGAGWAGAQMQAAATQIFAPDRLIAAVLGDTAP